MLKEIVDPGEQNRDQGLDTDLDFVEVSEVGGIND